MELVQTRDEPIAAPHHGDERASLDTMLVSMIHAGGSDLHLTVGAPPVVRVNGQMRYLADYPPLEPADTAMLVRAAVSEDQWSFFEESHELDFAYSVDGLSRFRVNIYIQRGSCGAAFRAIPHDIKPLEELGVPDSVSRFAQLHRGLVLVTGPTGSGKTTTLAALLDLANRTRSAHIITIEDPIEFLHHHKQCLVNQREVGADTLSFSHALRSALRQDPDVILLGEMRDFETIETALLAAETGHLVLSTLHTLDATETINRIVAVFQPHYQQQVRIQLAGVLKAVVSMRLMPRVDIKGRVPAVEVLITTPFIRDCIMDKEKTHLIPGAIAQGTSQYGMQTFDQSIFGLLEQGLVSYDEALRWASNVDEFKLKVQGISTMSDLTRDDMAKSAQKAAGGHAQITRFGS